MSRDPVIDQMRVIGLALVILAHTNPPAWLFQVRNFDVILLVITAGMTFHISGGDSRGYPDYLWTRFLRLLIPVWIFLSALFLAMLPTPFISQFSASDIVESYLMAGGIGYVWIMRVFFLISVLAPFVAFVSKKVKSHYIFFSLIAVVLASITVLSILYADGLSENHSLLNVVLQTVCYVAVFSVGYRVVSVGRLGGLGGKVSIVAMAFLATIAVSLLSVGIEFQDYKFPPTGYFVVYGILGTLVIWQALAGLNRHRQPGRVDNLLSLVGSSTVWIYLWHIPVVLLQRATDLFPNFLVTWLAAMAFAMFAAFTQKAVITWLIERIRPRQDMKRLILGMFTG